MNRKRRKRRRKRAVQIGSGIGQAAAGGYLLKTGLDSGLPRTLGVRLERHSTSKKNAKKILKGGGYLDAGADTKNRKSTKLLDLSDDPQARALLKDSIGYNFVTGYHPQGKVLSNSPIKNVLARRVTSLGYRAQSEIDFDKLKNTAHAQSLALKNTPLAMIGKKGKTLFVPLSDREVKQNFLPDVDDPLAIRTQKKVKVYGNRYSATAGQLKKAGLIGSLKDNKGRVLSGAAILGTGGYLGTNLIGRGVKNIRNPKTLKKRKRRRKRRKSFKIRRRN